ncbi:hypothetical protein SPRG_13954 [Saprolegnia parasitica CBS 223.65]|uniref:Uncharacterized protein n=1 Tax=Saprolegnia parasitica (strain CBS 223.65) TaxID=695850 RepID=A0A067C384_SAPPC|nr:hypothetical protein SPRG_13954 [Saprolegnia parasitica CBS 223.65]KDO21026.1 hypothetical protein SPRG_13954 [Saprolegnia parasitica CBS 223.65]|eukprot:XP_012208278.1 hypothetical protein SPRG_13954 [Saprolegnia parasitica CBS 223.65]
MANSYNKVDNQGALMGNWVEEEALRDRTGYSRYKTWDAKEAMGLSHPRVIAHSSATEAKDYRASSRTTPYCEDFVIPSSVGPRERRRLEELHAQAKALKIAMDGEPEDMSVKESTAHAAFKAADNDYLVHGITRVAPRGKGGFKDYDPSIVGKTRGEVAAMDAAKLQVHKETPHCATVTKYTHAITSGEGLGFPLTAAEPGRNPFGKSTGFSNDLYDTRVRHAEASYPGAETILGNGMNIHARSAVFKLQQWAQAPDKRRALVKIGLDVHGAIALKELLLALHEISVTVPDKDIHQIFVYLDKNQCGAIEWTAFEALVLKL